MSIFPLDKSLLLDHIPIYLFHKNTILPFNYFKNIQRKKYFGDRFGIIILAFSSQGLQMKMLRIAWIPRLNGDLSLHIFLWITRVLVANNAKHFYLHFLYIHWCWGSCRYMASKLVKILDQHRCFGGYHTTGSQ